MRHHAPQVTLVTHPEVSALTCWRRSPGVVSETKFPGDPPIRCNFDSPRNGKGEIIPHTKYCAVVIPQAIPCEPSQGDVSLYSSPFIPESSWSSTKGYDDELSLDKCSVDSIMESELFSDSLQASQSEEPGSDIVNFTYHIQ